MLALVIVESPAKAKTIQKFLGKGFFVMASNGHVRDLIPKKNAVLPDKNFEMRYQVLEKNLKQINAIADKLAHCDALYLATDPDREGEAIAWHLCQILEERGLLDHKPVHRVVFHEITKSAVQAAIQQPRELSRELINSQQGRRALDYLVGFNLSPLLWKKVRRGLSAGRVQSPALDMIVARHDEIERFKPEEYWTIIAGLQAKRQTFTAKLVEFAGEKLGQFSINHEAQAQTVVQTLTEAAAGHLLVDKVTKSQRKKNPSPPFTTSTLQQEASRKLGFSTQRTMRVAQQLYEGIDVGEGAVGLITYMRTDSVNLAQEALQQMRAYIEARYGADCLPDSPRYFKTKSKNAQEAHEAIRPTAIELAPEKLKHALSSDQMKLYTLIWKRAVACQMEVAIMDVVTAELTAGEGNRFRASGSVLTSPGYMTVYQEGVDEAKKDKDKEDEQDKLLPPLAVGEKVAVKQIDGNQHFTEPPPKYSEASLVKSLEEYGIGRPSTYAAIISTLLHRDYVKLENKRFVPTDVGKIVNKFLKTYFAPYVDYDFTAKLEDSLDEVARGEKHWLPLLSEFWQPFNELVQQVEENVQRKDVTHEALDEACPKCQKPLSIRLGKRGRFVGCTGYPDCDYTRSLEEDREASLAPTVVEGRDCPKCHSQLVIKRGRYGKFIGCSAYPECKFIESLEKPEDTQVTCPECHKGSLVKRKSRFGTFFYSCNRYPDCKYAIKHPPLNEPCPQCHWPIMTLKTTKRRGTEKACPQKTCLYLEAVTQTES